MPSVVTPVACELKVIKPLGMKNVVTTVEREVALAKGCINA